MSRLIDSVWMFVYVDPEDDTEGVISISTKLGHVPLMAADESRLADMRRVAQDLVNSAPDNFEVRVIKLSVREVVETLRPGGIH